MENNVRRMLKSFLLFYKFCGFIQSYLILSKNSCEDHWDFDCRFRELDNPSNPDIFCVCTFILSCFFYGRVVSALTRSLFLLKFCRIPSTS